MFVDDEQVVEQVQDSPQEETQVEETPTESKPVESSAEKNFRALREEAARARKERDAALLALKKMEEERSLNQKDEDELNDDSLVEGKHLNKTQKRLRKLESELSKYQQQNSELAAETRLKSQYPDFDQVVTKDNVEALKKAYPEVAHMLQVGPDLYASAASAYTLIKKFGITQEDNYSQDRALAQKNSSKPRTLSSISPQQGESPMSRANAFANGLTDDRKKQLWKEMEDARKAS